MTTETQLETLTRCFTEILEALGLDLADTPERVANMYVHELFSGLIPDNAPDLTFYEEPSTDGQIIRIDDIEVTSTCEHHLMPIMGTAEVAYIPRGKLLGLSKIHRLVDFYARRPQLQERLTAQIADTLSSVLSTPDIAVRIQAWHGCISCRGVQHRHSATTTTTLRGSFQATDF